MDVGVEGCGWMERETGNGLRHSPFCIFIIFMVRGGGVCIRMLALCDDFVLLIGVYRTRLGGYAHVCRLVSWFLGFFWDSGFLCAIYGEGAYAGE
jgi:hypothetical protein